MLAREQRQQIAQQKNANNARTAKLMGSVKLLARNFIKSTQSNSSEWIHVSVDCVVRTSSALSFFVFLYLNDSKAAVIATVQHNDRVF